MIIEFIEINKEISVKEWEDKITKLISKIDDDASGKNGLEYTLEDAKENGFNTTVEYFFSKCKSNAITERTEEFLSLYMSTWNCSCDEHDTKIVERDDSIVVIIAISY